MQIRFEPELFTKLYKLAHEEDMHIPALVNKLLNEILSEEEKNAKNGTIPNSKNR